MDTNRLLVWSKIILYLTLSISVFIVAAAFVDVAQRANETLVQTDVTLKHLDATVTDTRRVVLSIGGTAAEMRGAAQEQRKQALETTKQVTLLVGDLRTTAGRINNETLPALNRAIADSSAQIGKVTEEAAGLIHDTNEQMQPLLKSTQVVVENVAQSSEKLNKSMDDISSTLKHVDATAGNVEAMSKDTAEAVHRLTRPARSTWEVMKGIGKWFLAAFTAFK